MKKNKIDRMYDVWTTRKVVDAETGEISEYQVELSIDPVGDNKLSEEEVLGKIISGNAAYSKTGKAARSRLQSEANRAKADKERAKEEQRRKDRAFQQEDEVKEVKKESIVHDLADLEGMLGRKHTPRNDDICSQLRQYIRKEKDKNNPDIEGIEEAEQMWSEAYAEKTEAAGTRHVMHYLKDDDDIDMNAYRRQCVDEWNDQTDNEGVVFAVKYGKLEYGPDLKYTTDPLVSAGPFIHIEPQAYRLACLSSHYTTGTREYFADLINPDTGKELIDVFELTRLSYVDLSRFNLFIGDGGLDGDMLMREKRKKISWGTDLDLIKIQGVLSTLLQEGSMIELPCVDSTDIDKLLDSISRQTGKRVKDGRSKPYDAAAAARMKAMAEKMKKNKGGDDV